MGAGKPPPGSVARTATKGIGAESRNGEPKPRVKKLRRIGGARMLIGALLAGKASRVLAAWGKLFAWGAQTSV